MTDLDALGVYIYGGGFTAGVRAAGFNTVAHLEDGDFGVETAKRNFPGLQVSTERDSWDLSAFEGVQFVYGNPPCAPWSSAANRVGNGYLSQADRYRRDPRTACVWHMMDVWRKLRPRVWVWESVQNAYKHGFPMVQDIACEAKQAGYAFTGVLFNAVDVGVPHYRRRWFGVIHDVEIPWSRTPYPLVPEEKRPTPRTVWDGLPATSEMQVPSTPSQWLMCTAAAEPGEKLWSAFDRLFDVEALRENGRVKGRPGFLRARLDYDAVAPTHTGGPHLYHPEEVRAISVEEARRLAGYPDTWWLPDSIEKAHQVMFKAVMPAAGEWIARYAHQAICEGKPAAVESTVIDFEKGQTQALLTP